MTVLDFPEQRTQDHLPAHIDLDSALLRLRAVIAAEVEPLQRHRDLGMTTVDPVIKAIALLLLREGAATAEKAGVPVDIIQREVTDAFALPTYEPPLLASASTSELKELEEATRAKIAAIHERFRAVKRWRRAILAASDAGHKKSVIGEVANITPRRVAQLLRERHRRLTPSR